MRDGLVRTTPYDASKVEDPSLIIYAALRKFENHVIVTNGDQTDTVYDFLTRGKTFAEALDDCMSVRNTLFKNLNYPFTYARGILLKMYNHKVIQGPSAFMVSWLPFAPESVGNVDMEFRTYNLGRYFNPLYAITFPNPHTGGITINYMYRYKLVSEKNVRSFHENAVNIIMKGIENPNITVRELLNGVVR